LLIVVSSVDATGLGVLDTVVLPVVETGLGLVVETSSFTSILFFVNLFLSKLNGILNLKRRIWFDGSSTLDSVCSLPFGLEDEVLVFEGLLFAAVCDLPG